MEHADTRGPERRVILNEYNDAEYSSQQLEYYGRIKYTFVKKQHGAFLLYHES